MHACTLYWSQSETFLARLSLASSKQQLTELRLQ